MSKKILTDYKLRPVLENWLQKNSISYTRRILMTNTDKNGCIGKFRDWDYWEFENRDDALMFVIQCKDYFILETTF